LTGVANTFERADLTSEAPLPGAPYALVYARLLLYHLPERVAVLRRLWDAVAPGGHLLIQDYDVRSVTATPPLESVDEFGRIIVAAFTAAGCDVHVGSRLPELFARAGIGAPDGTDVAGRLDSLAGAQRLLTGVFRSILPTALEHGLITEDRAAAWQARSSATTSCSTGRSAAADWSTRTTPPPAGR
jgi:SAM-dependent methyltransferase